MLNTSCPPLHTFQFMPVIFQLMSAIINHIDSLKSIPVWRINYMISLILRYRDLWGPGQETDLLMRPEELGTVTVAETKGLRSPFRFLRPHRGPSCSCLHLLHFSLSIDSFLISLHVASNNCLNSQIWINSLFQGHPWTSNSLTILASNFWKRESDSANSSEPSHTTHMLTTDSAALGSRSHQCLVSDSREMSSIPVVDRPYVTDLTWHSWAQECIC